MYIVVNSKQSCPIRYYDQRSNCIPWLGYDGGAVLVQGAMGEPATDSYKVSSFLLENCIIK